MVLPPAICATEEQRSVMPVFSSEGIKPFEIYQGVEVQYADAVPAASL